MRPMPRFLCLPSIAALLLSGSNLTHAAVGATTPFTTLEAESGTLDGGATVHSMTGPITQHSAPEMESSGRAYVELKGTGQSITWTNKTTQSFTAINIRFSMPDAPTGGGTTNTLDLYIDGKLRQSVPLCSAQCWLYKNNGTKDPSAGSPYKFFDETHQFITGAPVAPGSTIMLKQDDANNAEFYWIDVIDLETPPDALPQPPDSLSITDFGAKADDATFDSQEAMQHCFDAAKSQKKTAWIPKGTFYINSAKGLHATDITIAGAGTWYSTIYRRIPLPSPKGVSDMIVPTSCTVKDIHFDQNASARDGAFGDGGGINIKGTGWLVDTVWVEHTSSGVWGDGTNGLVKNSRMLSTWGDGINLNNGNSGNVGENLTAENNFIRGSGDDGLAINSDLTSHQMKRITFINNTAVAPYQANCFGIYGGIDVLVKDNLLMDGAMANGLSVGVFGNGGAPLESGVVEGNVIVRCGNKDHPGLNIGTHNETHSIANVYVGSNTITAPITRGIGIGKGTNIVIQNNHIDGGGLPGFVFDSFAEGSGIFNGNTAEHISKGDPATLASTAKYAVIAPIPAGSYKNSSGKITAETCGEGGQDISGLNDGDYTVYPGIDLTNAVTFVARVASSTSGGTLSVYLDNLKTPVVGTCTVPVTGGDQTWVDVSCTLTGATGTHDVYLLYNGTGKGLFNVEWFAFTPSPLTIP